MPIVILLAFILLFLEGYWDSTHSSSLLIGVGYALIPKYEFLKDFQTLLAGVFAIIAAGIAYRAAISQSAMSRQLHEESLRESIRATAASFYAELLNVRLRFYVTQKRIREDVENLSEYVWEYIPVRCLAYETNIMSVGKLPSTIAYAVMRAYHVIEVTNERCCYFKSNEMEKTESQSRREEMAEAIDPPLVMLSLLLPKLASVAEIEPNLASIMEQLNREEVEVSVKAAE